MHNASPVTPINYWQNCTKGVWWPCYIGSDIWFQTDLWLGFEKYLHLASRAASQRLYILRKSWRVFHDQEERNTHFWEINISVKTAEFIICVQNIWICAVKEDILKKVINIRMLLNISRWPDVVTVASLLYFQAWTIYDFLMLFISFHLCFIFSLFNPLI